MAINTSRVETSPDDHHGHKVLVLCTYQPARFAGVGSLEKCQVVLGHRSALEAVHRGPPWINELKFSTVFMGHRRLGKELRFEVFHSNLIVVHHH